MSLAELRRDAAELDALLGSATRQRVKDVLVQAKAQIDREIVNLEIKEKQQSGEKTKPTTSKRYMVELNEYAWDQSDKFVKVFVSLSGVQAIDESNVTVIFTENSMNLLVKDLNGKDYSLVMNNLLQPIDVEKSYRKVKNDMIAIYIKKQVEGKKWDNLTTIQKRLKDKQENEFKAKEDGDDNPENALMNIMKKMYNSGDTNTKQMIAKAWTESQEKRSAGGLPMDM